MKAPSSATAKKQAKGRLMVQAVKAEMAEEDAFTILYDISDDETEFRAAQLQGV